jgi:hypothetical protein
MNKAKYFNTWIFALLLLCFAGFALNTQAQGKTPQLAFVKEFEDLGSLNVQDLQLFKFEIEFVNKGDAPLLVSQVRGCCGTRITEWTTEPVMPGKKGLIKIEFRLNPHPQTISRTLTVLSNDPEGMKIYRIRGQVVDTAVSLIH